MGLESRLDSIIAARAPYWLDFLKQLIRTPSVTGDESAAQNLVRNAMRDIGIFERDIYASSEPPYIITKRDYSSRPSVVGRIPGGGVSSFILNAHIDTAPVECATSWSYPPFQAIEEDGKIWGRGALDDKSGVAMMLLIAESIKKAGLKLPGDILFQSVIEDEDTGNGTLSCTEAGYFADAAIILDGTWPFRIIDAHLGQVWLKFEVYGKPAPSCSLCRAVNPVNIALNLISRLEAMVESWNQGLVWEEVSSPCFVSVGQIRSGVWEGAIPEMCEFGCQIGFAPPYNLEAVIHSVRQVACDCSPKGAIPAIKVDTGFLCCEPFANRKNPLVTCLEEVISRRQNGEMHVKAVAVRGHCDLRHFRTEKGLPTAACLYGPGGGGNPHIRDEYYEVSHFIPVAQNIAATLLAWYGKHR